MADFTILPEFNSTADKGYGVVLPNADNFINQMMQAQQLKFMRDKYDYETGQQKIADTLKGLDYSTTGILETDRPEINKKVNSLMSFYKEHPEALTPNANDKNSIDLYNQYQKLKDDLNASIDLSKARNANVTLQTNWLQSNPNFQNDENKGIIDNYKSGGLQSEWKGLNTANVYNPLNGIDDVVKLVTIDPKTAQDSNGNILTTTTTETPINKLTTAFMDGYDKAVQRENYLDHFKTIVQSSDPNLQIPIFDSNSQTSDGTQKDSNGNLIPNGDLIPSGYKPISEITPQEYYLFEKLPIAYKHIQQQEISSNQYKLKQLDAYIKTIGSGDTENGAQDRYAFIKKAVQGDIGVLKSVLVNGQYNGYPITDVIYDPNAGSDLNRTIQIKYLGKGANGKTPLEQSVQIELNPKTGAGFQQLNNILNGISGTKTDIKFEDIQKLYQQDPDFGGTPTTSTTTTTTSSVNYATK